MSDLGFLRETPRKYAQAGKVIGQTGDYLSQIRWRIRNNKDTLKRSLVFSRILVNLSDEALNFFCDDKNFQKDEPLQINFKTLSKGDK